MRMFPYYCDEDKKYRIAVKGGNKRKSRNFYYRMIGYSGVEFIKRNKYAHSCLSKEDAESLIKYLKKRIGEVGFVFRA